MLPTEADWRDCVVSDVEPVFGATPALRGLLAADTEGENRNTLTPRRLPGGSLKMVSAGQHRAARARTVSSGRQATAARSGRAR